MSLCLVLQKVNDATLIERDCPKEGADPLFYR